MCGVWLILNLYLDIHDMGTFKLEDQWLIPQLTVWIRLRSMLLIPRFTTKISSLILISLFEESFFSLFGFFIFIFLFVSDKHQDGWTDQAHMSPWKVYGWSELKKVIPKNFSTILQSQFNHHTLAVTPFKKKISFTSYLLLKLVVRPMTMCIVHI